MKQILKKMALILLVVVLSPVYVATVFPFFIVVTVFPFIAGSIWLWVRGVGH
jgi:hypothetical protein